MCDEFIHPGLVTDTRLSRRSFGVLTVGDGRGSRHARPWRNRTSSKPT